MFTVAKRLGGVALGCLVAACAPAEEDNDASGGAALSDVESSPAPSSALLAAGAAHSKAVLACGDLQRSAEDTSRPPDARVQAAKDQWQCVVNANDKLLAAIDPVVKSNGALADGSAGIVKDYRDSAHALCDALTALTPSWDLKKYACYGNREFDLGAVLNAYGNVTSKPRGNVWGAFAGDGQPTGPRPSKPVGNLDFGSGLKDPSVHQSIASAEICTVAKASFGASFKMPAQCESDTDWLLYVEILLVVNQPSPGARCWAIAERASVCAPPNGTP